MYGSRERGRSAARLPRPALDPLRLFPLITLHFSAPAGGELHLAIYLLLIAL